MTKRKKNQGRHYDYDEWLEFMVEGSMEYEQETIRMGEHPVLGVDCAEYIEDLSPEEVIAASDLEEHKEKYERDVEKAIKAWAKKHPLKEDYEVDDLIDRGAFSDVWFALSGAGAGGIFEGEWNEYFVDGDRWGDEELIDFLRKRVGKYVDDAGGGSFQWAIMDAVSESFSDACEEAMKGMMTEAQFNEYFKEEILPMVAEKYERDGMVDRIARAEAYNDTIDAMIKDDQLPPSAADWEIPDRLERGMNPAEHPSTHKLKAKLLR